VEVELLVIPECLGADEATKLLRTALDDIGLARTPFTVGVIDTDDAARAPRVRRLAGVHRGRDRSVPERGDDRWLAGLPGLHDP
jgi:hypothetical protein